MTRTSSRSEQCRAQAQRVITRRANQWREDMRASLSDAKSQRSQEQATMSDSAQAPAKPSLVRQIAAGEVALGKALQEKSCFDPDGVRALAATLAWIRDNEDALRLAVLLRNDPAVQQVRDAFPGATIAAVRPRHIIPTYEDGDEDDVRDDT